MKRLADTNRSKQPSHPRVPGSKSAKDAARVARAYRDLFWSDDSDRYRVHLHGRRVGPKPSLGDYEGSEI
jgi:hypothetical protein